MDALEYSVCHDNGWPYRPMPLSKGASEATSSNQELNQQHPTSDTTWDLFVTKKLSTARGYLSELYPLNYRVEILEDIFSLLFIRHEHLTTEGTSVASDSAGEEGLVDEDWQNKSITSLESIEVPEPSQYSAMLSQPHPTKEVTFLQAASETRKTQSQGDEEVFDKVSTEKAGAPVSGILKQRISGLHGNGSSEASQYSNGSLNLQGKVGFVASERFTRDIIGILKECMLDLTSTKFAMSGSGTGKSDVQQQLYSDGKSNQSAREMSKYLKCAVKPSTLAQRISKLSQHINEAWWRFQLVSQSRQSTSGGGALGGSETSTVHESSSDEDWRSFKGSDAEDGELSDGRKKRKKRKRHEGRSRSASGKCSVYGIMTTIKYCII